jgi:hypothetical protein
MLPAIIVTLAGSEAHGWPPVLIVIVTSDVGASRGTRKILLLSALARVNTQCISEVQVSTVGRTTSAQFSAMGVQDAVDDAVGGEKKQ